MKILLIPGSLRKKSYNKALAHAAASLAPKEANAEVFELNEIPLFNGDLEDDLPESVEKLYYKVKESDGLIYVTPEYNRSYSGVMKNAVDWISRKGLNKNKPGAIMGASDGYFGSARAQAHLKTLLTEQWMNLMIKPEVLIPEAQNSFDDEGTLINKEIEERVKDFMMSFIDWIKKSK